MSRKNKPLRTCRSCFAASAATLELNVTNPTGCEENNTREVSIDRN